MKSQEGFLRNIEINVPLWKPFVCRQSFALEWKTSGSCMSLEKRILRVSQQETG
ncbi:MAG: hypothetical protein KZQ77_03595 [Candidatus Thiodiazotropha sp. (ex Notomyrtea botanica)]|nr:hypothetical protein [Candidatus Thiodiazotropha sp. (ex Notomyrtea botanica)]